MTADPNAKDSMKNKGITQKCLLILLIAGVVVAASVLLLMVFLRAKQPEMVPLPAEEDVDTLTVSVHDLLESMGIPPVPEYDVPREYIPVLLSGVTPARTMGGRTPLNPRINPILGEMTIKTKAGASIYISIHDLGKTVAGFTVDGVQCVRDGEYKPIFVCQEYQSYTAESLLLCEIIRGIYEEQQAQKKSNELSRRIDELQRSIGEKLPERR
jgi:hypothetical protein